MNLPNEIQEYVAQNAPAAYSKIENPEAFFEDILQELQESQEAMLAALMDPPGVQRPEDLTADPLELVARHRQKTDKARELAWHQVVVARFPRETTS